MAVFNNCISEWRSQIMCLAIIGVVAYHWQINFETTAIPVLSRFLYMGYLGVDVFLICSGFGLVFSYPLHSLKDFYRRRYIKILPLFALFQVLKLALTYYLGDNFSFGDVLCRFSTLSLFLDTSHITEWYINMLVWLYLLFPLIYRFVSSCGIWSVFLTTGASLLILYGFTVGGIMTSILLCLPVFVVGVYFGIHHDDIKRLLAVSIIGLAIAFLGKMSGFYSLFTLNEITTMYWAGPFMTVFFALVLSVTGCRAGFMESIGRHTLEIYLANILANDFCLYYVKEVAGNIQAQILYFLLTILLSVAFMFINRLLQSFLRAKCC